MNIDFEDAILEKAPPEIKPLLVFPGREILSPKALSDAVVFIHAVWSGPSVATYRVFISVLVQTKCSVPVVIYSADEVDYEAFANSYGRTINYGGWGETFVVSKGVKSFECSNKTENYYQVLAEVMAENFRG